MFISFSSDLNDNDHFPRDGTDGTDVCWLNQ